MGLSYPIFGDQFIRSLEVHDRAFGHHSLVTVLTRCGLPLPVYFLADEKHSRCLTEKVYLPTIVCGRVLWHLGYTEEASAVAFTQ